MTTLTQPKQQTKALLVYPRFPLTYWGFQHTLRLIGKKAALPPLGLITVAALLPSHWSLRLVDLNVTELQDADLMWADVVLTGGMLIQTASMQEVIARGHAWQLPVAVGGPAPTTSPQLFPDADVVFRGEAEGRIDELVQALAQKISGQRVLDAAETFPDLESTPPPRYDLLDLTKYASMSVQFSRGCPFHCEFCDIVEIFGRSPRVKTPVQMLSELDLLYDLGYRGTVFFVDDNFIGNKAAVLRLLASVSGWQRARGRPFDLYTEASIDLAVQSRLLIDMVEAGFSSVFVGIETPSTKALVQTKKHQNLKLDLAESIDRITRAGLEVMGGFIVGFDSDGEDIFAMQKAFLARQPIPLAMVGMLMALPGTQLWRRLDAEGRLHGTADGDPFAEPNFTPRMGTQALLKGYAHLLEWLYSPPVYYARCEAYLDRAGTRPNARPATWGDVRSFLRTIWHVGILGSRRRLFWRLLTRSMSHGLDRTRQAVVHAVQGEHLIRYTKEYVLPRLALSLAELPIKESAPVLVSPVGHSLPRPRRLAAVSGAVSNG